VSKKKEASGFAISKDISTIFGTQIRPKNEESDVQNIRHVYCFKIGEKLLYTVTLAYPQ